MKGEKSRILDKIFKPVLRLSIFLMAFYNRFKIIQANLSYRRTMDLAGKIIKERNGKKAVTFAKYFKFKEAKAQV